MIYSFFWGVDAASPSRRQAWDLVRWLNDARGPGGLSCTGAMLSGMGDLTGNRRDLAAMAGTIADPFSRGFVAALGAPGAVPQANLWHAEEVDRLLAYYIQLAWFGRMTPQVALAKADREIRAILAEQPR
jgi:multiple sugar transport system substrate-binding protein